MGVQGQTIGIGPRMGLPGGAIIALNRASERNPGNPNNNIVSSSLNFGLCDACCCAGCADKSSSHSSHPLRAVVVFTAAASFIWKIYGYSILVIN